MRATVCVKFLFQSDKVALKRDDLRGHWKSDQIKHSSLPLGISNLGWWSLMPYCMKRTTSKLWAFYPQSYLSPLMHWNPIKCVLWLENWRPNHNLRSNRRWVANVGSRSQILLSGGSTTPGICRASVAQWHTPVPLFGGFAVRSWVVQLERNAENKSPTTSSTSQKRKFFQLFLTKSSQYFFVPCS